MYNASFYPTPPEVAEKMLAKVGKLYERSILEPSAGKGDLADAAVGKLDRYYNRCREIVHCIEIEPELQAHDPGQGLSAGRHGLPHVLAGREIRPDHHEPALC